MTVHLEGEQVPLVDSHQVGARVHGPVELDLVVHLDQSGQAELGGERAQPDQLGVGQGGHDEQDGVGSHHAGVADVGRRHGEVLAQHRQLDRPPGGGQIGRRPAEEPGVGQHRQAGRSSRRIGDGDGGGVEIDRQIAPRGRAPLELGDDRHAVPTQRLAKWPRFRRPTGGLGQLLDGAAVLLRPGAMHREDPVEVGGHVGQMLPVNPPRTPVHTFAPSPGDTLDA